MLYNPETEFHKIFDVEVDKAKKRLDAVYSETENLKKDKLVLEADIIRIDKHIAYLNSVIDSKQTEIDTKKKNIESLDKQIGDSHLELNRLQKQESDIILSLNSKKEEMDSVLEKIRIESEKHSIDKKNIEENLISASKKHASAQEKLEKIVSFISSL